MIVIPSSATVTVSIWSSAFSVGLERAVSVPAQKRSPVSKLIVAVSPRLAIAARFVLSPFPAAKFPPKILSPAAFPPLQLFRLFVAVVSEVVPQLTPSTKSSHSISLASYAHTTSTSPLKSALQSNYESLPPRHFHHSMNDTRSQ